MPFNLYMPSIYIQIHRMPPPPPFPVKNKARSIYTVNVYRIEVAQHTTHLSNSA